MKGASYKKLVNNLKSSSKDKNKNEKKKVDSLEDISQKRKLHHGKMNDFLKTKFEIKTASFKNSNMQIPSSKSEKNLNPSIIEEKKNPEIYSSSLKKSSSIKIINKENSVNNNSVDWRTDFNIADDRSKDSKYEESKQKSKLILDSLKNENVEHILISSTKSFNYRNNNIPSPKNFKNNRENPFKITLKNENNSRNEMNIDMAMDSNRYYTYERPTENSLYVKTKIPLARKFSTIYTKLKDISKSNSLKKSQNSSKKKNNKDDSIRHNNYTINKIIEFSICGLEDNSEKLRHNKGSSNYNLEKRIFQDIPYQFRKIESYFIPKVYGVNRMKIETDKFNVNQLKISPKVSVCKINAEEKQIYHSNHRSPSSKSRFKEIIESTLRSPKPERVIKIEKLHFKSPEINNININKGMRSFFNNRKYENTLVKKMKSSPSKIDYYNHQRNDSQNINDFFLSSDENKPRMKELKEINFVENNKIKYNILKEISSIQPTKSLFRPFSEKLMK